MNSTTNNLGQKPETWDDFWKGVSPLSEIRMWDYYGGRQWITKYVPRFGKVIAAGCGAGRYVFYLSKLGIDIEGIDFSASVVEKLYEFSKEAGSNPNFLQGDVTALPYADNSLSGYISLGVVGHFIDGPQKPLAEAFRVLRPGGIAIVTTPNKSFYVRYNHFKKQIKSLVKLLIRRKNPPEPFFQYEYSPIQLNFFLKKQGFYVSRAEGCDLLYPFTEMGHFSGNNIYPNSFAYRFANRFENSVIKYFGGQSVTISVKKAPLMYCFLCGELNATLDSLNYFDVPISKKMQQHPAAQLFLKNRRVQYAQPYTINPPLLKPETRKCSFTGKSFLTNPVFEDFGFDIPVSEEALKNIYTNIDLCCNHIKPLWRKRAD